MSDLKLAPERDRTSTTAILVALLVLAVVAFAVFALNPRRTAELSVKDVRVFAPHTTFDDLQAGSKGVHVLDQTPQTEDNLYVVATVSLADKLRLPLFISGWSATATLADGSVVEGSSVAAHDLQRLSDIFPALAPMVGKPLHDGDEVAPSTTSVGSVVVLFPGMNQSTWQSRKLARLIINLRNQGPQVVTLP